MMIWLVGCLGMAMLVAGGALLGAWATMRFPRIRRLLDPHAADVPSWTPWAWGENYARTGSSTSTYDTRATIPPETKHSSTASPLPRPDTE